MSLRHTLILGTGILILGSIAISLIISLYIAHRELDEVLEKMSRESLQPKRTSLTSGPRDKIILTGTVSLIMALSEFSIKYGLATREEIDSVSPAFKRKLTVLFWADIVLAVSLAIFGGGAKLGWIKA